jgi:transcription-repair coupling factor (superfamily II helicase)
MWKYGGVGMRLKGLMQPLNESEQFQEILDNINGKKLPVGIYGISESAKSYLINGLYSELDKPILIVTHSDMEARNLYEDLSFYLSKVYYLPTKEVVFYNIDAISGDLRWERIKVMKEMLKGGNKIIITCIEALAAQYLPVDLFKEYTFKLSVGNIINLKNLSEKLVQCGYERTVTVENRGQFSIRGGGY